MASELLIHVLAWVALIAYLAGFVPQIFENYQQKSARGWNDLFILSYFVGYTALLYYTFGLNLMLPYKIIVPLECFFMAIVIAQRFYYDGIFSSKLFSIGFLVLSALLLGTFPYFIAQPAPVGTFFGWVSFVFFTINPIPQALKMYFDKSTQGFSFGFLTLFALASLTELLVAIIGYLPVPTVFMIIKNLIFCVIWYAQFWLYRKR